MSHLSLISTHRTSTQVEAFPSGRVSTAALARPFRPVDW